jgi:hypothetical protein
MEHELAIPDFSGVCVGYSVDHRLYVCPLPMCILTCLFFDVRFLIIPLVMCVFFPVIS